MTTTTHAHAHAHAIGIRHASSADSDVLADLAALDGRAPLGEHALVAEVDGAARAALDLHDGSVAADPFARTADLVELLKLHAGVTRPVRSSLRGRVTSLLRPVSLRA